MTAPNIGSELTSELAPARAILLLGHGTGRANNASHHALSYVEKHHPHEAAADLEVPPARNARRDETAGGANDHAHSR